MSMNEHNELLTRLGLLVGQCGDDSKAHNGSWFDKTGTKVGWGDIGKADIPRIKEKLKEGEVFFVVGEHESYWDLYDWKNKKFTIDPLNPGLDWVLEKFRFYITNQGVFRAKDMYTTALEGETLVERSQVKKLLGLQ